MKVADVIKSISTKEKNRVIQLPVRELEQEGKGSYVAFVDDREHSYDVQLSIQASKITAFTCDCPQGETLCLHKIAVLIATQENKGTTTVIAKRKKKKLTETEELMLRIDKEAITGWLSDVFKKNKPLEQLFLLTFSTEEKQYTTEQVKEMMEQTIKSVAGRRKTLEGANVKKLLDLMNIALDPVKQFVTTNLNKSIAYEIYVVVIETMTDFQNRIHTYSKKLDAFYDDYVEWFAITINTIQVEDVWQKVVKEHIVRSFIQAQEKSKIAYRTYNDNLVKQIYLSATKNQKTFVVDELKHCILTMGLVRKNLDIDYVLFLKEMALDEDIYEEVESFFKIEKYSW